MDTRDGAVRDLSQVMLAGEIRRLGRERWSGVLALTQGEVTKGLFFVEGRIAFAASTVEEDRLGATLYRSGKITEAQFRAGMKASEGPASHLGQALVDAGVIGPEDLAAAVVAQVERIVLSVLRWTTGQLRFDAMDRPIPADLAVDLDTPRLLLLGARQFPDAARLERALGDPARRLCRAPAPFDYDALPPSPAERAVLALCTQGPAVLGDLLELPHPRGDVARAVFALLAGGLLRAVADVTPAPAHEAAAAEAQALDPEQAERSARALLERDQRPRALLLLQATLERHPRARGPRRLLALTLSREPGFQAEVEGHFVQALEGNAGDVELRYALASYYRRAGMTAKALLQLRAVLSTDPSHAAAWRDLGELEASQGRRGR